MHAQNISVQVVCMHTCSDVFVQGFYNGNKLRLMCMTLLSLQNAICLKQNWNTLKGMHIVCILFAQSVHKVCISRLCAHFFWLHCWVCRLSAHIEQTKYKQCAYLWVYFNSVLNRWHFGVIEMSYTSISTCFLYKTPGQKHLN